MAPVRQKKKKKEHLTGKVYESAEYIYIYTCVVEERLQDGLALASLQYTFTPFNLYGLFMNIRNDISPPHTHSHCFRRASKKLYCYDYYTAATRVCMCVCACCRTGENTFPRSPRHSLCLLYSIRVIPKQRNELPFPSLFHAFTIILWFFIFFEELKLSSKQQQQQQAMEWERSNSIELKIHAVHIYDCIVKKRSSFPFSLYLSLFCSLLCL